MPTCCPLIRGLAWGPRLLAGLVILASAARPALAQDRRYLVELGVAGTYTGFDDSTRLKGGTGFIGRIGVWLPLNFSVEGEGTFAKPKTEIGDTGVRVRTLGASLLYNVFFGSSTSGYLKFGGGSTRYGSNCPALDQPAPGSICGSTRALIGGVGARFAITPALLARGELSYLNNRGNAQVNDSIRSVTFSNIGANIGLSFMLGSKRLPDSDRDGVLNNRDTCADTPTGAQVDARGCPSDADSDGVPNGVDRCGGTPAGATVDRSGCPRDSDADNIVDGVDRCPETPEGVLVDPNGCPRDSDRDQIPDGLDRCSDTPQGATVDALGCPGDEDVDGVLDGLDRCPRTTTGAAVDAQGCSPSQPRENRTRPAPAPRDTSTPRPSDSARAQSPAAAPAPAPPPVARSRVRPAPERVVLGPVPTATTVLEGVTFAAGSARLDPSSYSALDSVAQVLQRNPAARFELAGHTSSTGSAADNLRISGLMAEAVRTYLIQKGVKFDQLAARGYGGTQPRTPDTTPQGLARNRRVELRPLLREP
ncbi:MAG: OmpA family protein [Gemmatimonadales bacterium]|nr:OmpA family protein [Gemmatimonadales bacterium]